MKIRKAFTLMELLVVISIIALLLAILMPSLKKARDQAKTIICGSIIKQIGIANVAYSSQCDGWFIPYMSGLPNNLSWIHNPLFLDIVGCKSRAPQYLLPKQISCPSDVRGKGTGLYVLGSNPTDGFIFTGASYGINLAGVFTVDAWGGGHYNPNIANAHKISKVIRPSQKLAFMDSTSLQIWFTEAEYTWLWDNYGDWIGPPSTWSAPSYRHNEGANIAFFDGHTEFRPKQKIYIIPNPRTLTRSLNCPMWFPTGKTHADSDMIYCN